METISFEEFKKVEIKIGTVLSVERLEGSDKLLKLMFDLGTGQPVQILAGIAQFYELEFLVGKQMPVVVNLEPRLLLGFHSNGMILAADGDGRPVILNPAQAVPPGSMVR